MAVVTTYDFTLVQGIDPLFATGAADAASLAGGGVAVAGDHIGHTDTTIFGPNGGIVGASNFHTGSPPSISQLSNGNIVVVATDTTDVFYRIMDGAGNVIVASTGIVAGSDNINADVTGGLT